MRDKNLSELVEDLKSKLSAIAINSLQGSEDYWFSTKGGFVVQITPFYADKESSNKAYLEVSLYNRLIPSAQKMMALLGSDYPPLLVKIELLRTGWFKNSTLSLDTKNDQPESNFAVTAEIFEPIKAHQFAGYVGFAARAFFLWDLELRALWSNYAGNHELPWPKIELADAQDAEEQLRNLTKIFVGNLGSFEDYI